MPDNNLGIPPALYFYKRGCDTFSGILIVTQDLPGRQVHRQRKDTSGQLVNRGWKENEPDVQIYQLSGRPA
jgi:hypothetical protein